MEMFQWLKLLTNNKQLTTNNQVSKHNEHSLKEVIDHLLKAYKLDDVAARKAARLAPIDALRHE